MATFRVGQRVRIVRCFLNQEPEIHALVGTETRITEVRTAPLWWPASTAYVVDVRHLAGPIAFTADQLEPIQYDSNTPVEWESCLWQPEGEIA